MFEKRRSTKAKPRSRKLHAEQLESRFLLAALPPAPIPGDLSLPFATANEVQELLARGAAASSSTDAIIAVVDRNGRILGVRMEQGVLDAIPDEATRVFAIDGAVAKARTAAFFANG